MLRKAILITALLCAILAKAQEKRWTTVQNLKPFENPDYLGRILRFSNGYIISSLKSQGLITDLFLFKKDDKSNEWEYHQRLILEKNLFYNARSFSFDAADSILVTLENGTYLSGTRTFRVKLFKLQSNGNWYYSHHVDLPHYIYQNLGSYPEIHLFHNFILFTEPNAAYDNAKDTLLAAGKVYILKHEQGEIGSTLDSFNAIQPRENDFFGLNIVCSDSNIFVAAPYVDYDKDNNDSIMNSGCIYVYSLKNEGIKFLEIIENDIRKKGELFGQNMTVKNNKLFVNSEHIRQYSKRHSSYMLDTLYQNFGQDPFLPHYNGQSLGDSTFYIFKSHFFKDTGTITGIVYEYPLIGIEVTEFKYDSFSPRHFEAGFSSTLNNFLQVDQDLVIPIYSYKNSSNINGRLAVLRRSYCINDTIIYNTHRCRPFKSVSHDFWIRESGEYLDSLITPGRCPLYFWINAIVDSPISVEKEVEFCNYYLSPSGRHSTTESKIIWDTMRRSNGCDSLIRINAQFIGVHPTLELNDGVLSTISRDKEFYQWIDCYTGRKILNENNWNFTPRNSGLYALKTYTNECDTFVSDCYFVSNFELNLQNIPELTISPNPNNGNFNIDWKTFEETVHVRIYNSTAELVHEYIFKESFSESVQLNLASGVYYLEVQKASDETNRVKVIIF